MRTGEEYMREAEKVLALGRHSLAPAMDSCARLAEQYIRLAELAHRVGERQSDAEASTSRQAEWMAAVDHQLDQMDAIELKDGPT